MKSITYTH